MFLEATSHSIDLNVYLCCHINLLYACGYHYLCNRVMPQIYLKAWVSFAVCIFSVSSWDVAIDCLDSPPFWAPNLKPACPVKHVVSISGLFAFLLFILTSADVSNFTLKGFLIFPFPPNAKPIWRCVFRCFITSWCSGDIYSCPFATIIRNYHDPQTLVLILFF